MARAITIRYVIRRLDHKAICASIAKKKVQLDQSTLKTVRFDVEAVQIRCKVRKEREKKQPEKSHFH